MPENPVLENLDQPELLEEAYRKSPREFAAQLREAFRHRSDSETLRVWNARLYYRPPTQSPAFPLTLLIAVCLFAGLLTRLPVFLPIGEDWFYSRFVPLIVISSLIVYFLKTSASFGTTQKVLSAGLLFGLAYLLILPDDRYSASIIMALLHLPLVFLTLLALSFMGSKWKETEARLNFIRYLGEMGIYTALILLGGIVLIGMTLSLFRETNITTGLLYLDNVVIWGLVSSPLVATYVFDSVQNRQSRLASILSNVFSPLFLITVLMHLTATVHLGKSPFIDREFLITFNGLLVVIMALTIFSISGKKKTDNVQLIDYINLVLIAATLVINAIALSAILFRWSEYGMSINRLVVTGANILIFIHMALLLKQYFGYIRGANGVEQLEATIATYLPVYMLWALIVSVIFPLIFQFE